MHDTPGEGEELRHEISEHDEVVPGLPHPVFGSEARPPEGGGVRPNPAASFAREPYSEVPVVDGQGAAAAAADRGEEAHGAPDHEVPTAGSPKVVGRIGEVASQGAQRGADAESRDVPRLMPNPYGEAESPEVTRVAQMPELVDLAEREPRSQAYWLLESRLDRAKYMADAVRTIAVGRSSLTLQAVDHLLEEERVREQLNPEEQRAHLSLRAAMRVDIAPDGRTPVSITVRHGLATSAWRAEILDVARQRFWNRSAFDDAHDDDATRMEKLTSDVRNFASRDCLTQVEEAHTQRGEAMTFVGDQARLAYNAIMRGFGVMAEHYARRHRLTPEDQNNLLDTMLRRIIYRSQTQQD